MKTVKVMSLDKKITKLLQEKKVMKNSLVYTWLQMILNGTTEFRPVYSQGSSWKFSSLIDKTNEFQHVLNMLKLEYSLTNDAPRGGKTGALITIITKVKI